MKSLPLPLLLATLLVAALVAAEQLVMPAAVAADAVATWTPPVEPHLLPVTAAACPATPAAGQATCLAESVPVPDRSAAAAAADAVTHAATRTAHPQLSLAPRTKTGDYTPQDLASLYGVPAGLTPAPTVGIVDVGRDPNTEAQLSYFRSYFGLPACTRDNGCFREVAQDGSGALPGPDADWVVETAIDVQAVSAICPSCHILLVDASSAQIGDLAAATQTATRLGASYVSLSYGSPESSGTANVRAAYGDPDVTYVAAAGDSGYGGGALFPASAPNVVAAGGTSVRLVSGVWQQSAWSGSGSGCSQQTLISAVQALLSLGSVCGGKRVVSDLAALADPNTGMLFYRGGAWYDGGGTSLAAPILAGLYALAGNHTAPLSFYRAPGGVLDVTAGATGSCSLALLCRAGTGWDGPTGMGTPSGLSGLGAAPGPWAATTGLLDLPVGYPARMTYHLSDGVTGAPVAGAGVLLERQLSGGGFTGIDAGTTNDNGAVVFTDAPTGAASYRVVFAGDAVRTGSTSNAVAVATFAARVQVSRSGARVRAVAHAPWGAALRSSMFKLEQRRGSRWTVVRRLRTNHHGRATARVHRGHTYRVAYGGGSWRPGHTRAISVR